jgi:arylsulfatase A-like enzyme
MQRFTIFLLLLVLPVFTLKAGQTEIRYYMPGASEVYLVWGINDWKNVDNPPPGTIIKNRIMNTPMTKEGDEFVIKIDMPPGNVIDYFFLYKQKEGLLRLTVTRSGFNNKKDNKFFHVKSNSNSVVNIKQDPQYTSLQSNIKLIKYGSAIFILCSIVAVLIFFIRKYHLSLPAESFNQKAFFIAASVTMLCCLFFIRAYFTQLLLPFLIKPIILPVLLKTFFSDFLYAFLLFVIFGLLFITRKKNRKAILITYSLFIFLSLVIAVLNGKLIQTVGKPFNFQWLYYSDFLKSTDASKAVKANFDPDFVRGSALILLSVIPLCWIIYRAYIKKPMAIALAFVLCISVGFMHGKNDKITKLQTVNPVFYFFSSLNGTESFSIFSGQSLGSKSEFNIKNNDTVAARYSSLFSQNKIKNVVVVILESTPAEYLTPYNKHFNTTPFLDSLKNTAVTFNAIYAHVPATNKSMVSFLCATYPDLSYKSITAENPDFAMPSISSELKKTGYRTAFINSGDNRYQNAEGFLKYRRFDTIQDFRNNTCANAVLTDKRYAKENLDGSSDSCLSVRLFNWVNQDTAKPFFAMLWTFQTHYPYYPTDRDTDYGTGNPSLEKYLNALYHADETIRQITEGLKKEHLLESTLIVVLGDHGEAFGRHGQTTHAAGIYEENLHIPLMFINPAFTAERVEAPGGITDIAPSILSVLNKPAPQQWQGENLFSDNRRKRVYFFSPYSDYLFGFREDHYKFIFNATDNSFALYDLEKDPQEATNIADKQPGFVKRAKTNLQSWMQYQSNFMTDFIKATTKP